MELAIKRAEDVLVDTEAEAGLIWGIGQDPGSVNYLDNLQPEDFSNSTLAAAFSDILYTLESGSTVITNQQMHSILQQYSVDGEAMARYLERTSLGNKTPTFSGTVDRIRDLSTRRKMRAAARNFLNDAQDLVMPAAAAMEALNMKLADVNETLSQKIEKTHYSEHVDDAIIRAQADESTTPMRLTGIDPIDNVIGGIAPGDVVTVGGLSGGGKSALGAEIALNFARRGEGVLYVTAEMAGVEIVARHVSSELCRQNIARVPYSHILRGVRDPGALSVVVREAMQKREALPIRTLGPRGNITPSEITQATNAYRADLEREGKELRLIVVDHIGLLSSVNSRVNSDALARSNEIPNALAGLARQTGIPILIMSQLVKSAGDRDPFYLDENDLLYGGVLRQASNVILMIDWPAYRLRRAIEKLIPPNVKRDTMTGVSDWSKDLSHPDFQFVLGAVEDPEDIREMLVQYRSIETLFEVSAVKMRSGSQGTASCTIEAAYGRIY